MCESLITKTDKLPLSKGHANKPNANGSAEEGRSIGFATRQPDLHCGSQGNLYFGFVHFHASLSYHYGHWPPPNLHTNMNESVLATTNRWQAEETIVSFRLFGSRRKTQAVPFCKLVSVKPSLLDYLFDCIRNVGMGPTAQT